MSTVLDWKKQRRITYCWDCGWSGSPKRANNRYVNAFALCPKCGAVLRVKSLEQHLEDDKCQQH